MTPGFVVLLGGSDAHSRRADFRLSRRLSAICESTADRHWETEGTAATERLFPQMFVRSAIRTNVWKFAAAASREGRHLSGDGGFCRKLNLVFTLSVVVCYSVRKEIQRALSSCNKY